MLVHCAVHFEVEGVKSEEIFAQEVMTAFTGVLVQCTFLAYVHDCSLCMLKENVIALACTLQKPVKASIIYVSVFTVYR